MLAADPADALRVLVQPIVDLQRGLVTGYEALGRVVDPEGRGIDQWLTAAWRTGHGIALETALARTALALRPGLPDNCFLTVNASPVVVVSTELARVLHGAGDLRGLVLEVTEHADAADPGELVRACDRWRAAGAIIAVDDLGAGHSGLNRMHQLRPQLIKIDRELVCGIDQDPARRTLVEMIGVAADRLDAWVLAEGVDSEDELRTLADLGVPLVQGFLLGRPGSPWPDLADPVTALLGRHRRRAPGPGLAALVEPATWVGRPGDARPEALRHGDVHVVCDDGMRPLAMAADPTLPQLTQRCRAVGLDDDPRQVLARVRTRPAHGRFDPTVVVDAAGRYVGVVRAERLIDHLVAG